MNPPPRILLIEDDARAASALRQVLSEERLHLLSVDLGFGTRRGIHQGKRYCRRPARPQIGCELSSG